MGVTFIATSRRRGNVHIVGPITGIDYLVTPFGTPVSDYDVAELLEETAPPCCGESVPLGGVVRLFG
ncbi:MAG: hypothetical protein GWN77_06550, partial [Gammaproteobacteria bacterium]|nr:hypothetical protein [Gammaproteobacteria bacterium]